MQIHNLFSVPVMDYSVDDEDLLATLRNHLDHERMINYEEEPYSIRGKTSHHTRSDLANLDSEWSRRLKALICKLANDWYVHVNQIPLPPVEQLDVHCWGMCMSEGDFSQVHNHPGADACGVLWLTIPEGREKREGQLVLMDPATSRRTGPGQYKNVDVEPKEGYGVVFGPYLEHYVEPFFGEGNRYSIAWNVTMR